ncbi:MAG: hypothetical protein F6K58_14780 [Symploca sp. SIO2E9]|nr:hypothetical protein [Symploca sp. SIO2E9]
MVYKQMRRSLKSPSLLTFVNLSKAEKIFLTNFVRNLLSYRLIGVLHKGEVKWQIINMSFIQLLELLEWGIIPQSSF